ncbi:hypothetical protein [Streptomyces sp. NPDC007346]|uniref:hypothetical protein n=1 Tax=Streptomyces sp. NPDC007346 TaxID=3154682 RepID=UPI00345477A5
MNDSLPPLSPNYASTKERVFTEQVEVHGKWPVEFQFRPARGDHRHLLVVFSSVGSKYGFGTMLDQVQCNILRIRDHFDDAASYYVARNMDFSVSDSIQALIQSYVERLRVSRDEVTLLGASKGASAALYYGVKYDYKNIIASTPQYFLGSYSKGHGQLGDAVLGEGQSDENVAIMDAVMPEVLSEETDFDRNIYVISSPGDYQYEAEVEHYLPALKKYENFNFLFVESPTVRRHDEVVRQALPSIWGIIHCLTEGAAPRWGSDLRIGPEAADPEEAADFLAELRGTDTVLAVLTRALFVNGRLEMNGHAFLPGVSREGVKEETKRLVLEKAGGPGGGAVVFPLESTKEIRLYRDYWDGYFAEYATGGFKLQEDFSLASLPRGNYTVSVAVGSEDEGIERRTQLVSRAAIDRRQCLGDSEILVRGGKKSLRILKRDIIGDDSGGLVYALAKSWSRDRKVHAEGVLFQPGRNADKISHGSYYLVLKGRNECFSFPLETKKNATAARSHRNDEDFGNYDWGYFSTPGREGVDVSHLPGGRYVLYVSFSAGGALFTTKAGKVTLPKQR